MKLLWNQETLGLDIGQAVTKAVLLKCNGKSATVVGTRVLDRRREGILNEGELSRELRPWLEQAGWHNREITVSIPQYIATTQVSDFFSVQGHSLEEMVAFETKHLAGLSEENFLHDYQLMPPAYGRAKPVLIGICRESVIMERAEHLAGVNLRLADFAVSSVALAAAYLYIYPETQADEALHLLLDIGAENATVAIVGKGNLLYSSSLLCGTDRYVQILARELGVSVEEAEKLKNDLSPADAEGDSPAGRAAAVFESELRSLIGQWHVEGQTEAGRCSLFKICLSGGGARIKGLAEFLAKKFACEGEVVGVPTTTGDSDPSLLIAYGLALQGGGVSSLSLSLAPKSILRQAHRRRRFPLLAGTAVLSAILVLILGIGDYRRLERRQQRMDRNLSAIEQSEAMLPEMKEMVEQTRLVEQFLLPYVAKGNNLPVLRRVINELGMARGEVALNWQEDEFADAWIIYLADEKSFHAGKPETYRRRDRSRQEPEVDREFRSPFVSLRNGSVNGRQGRPEETVTEVIYVNEIEPWYGFVAAVYTVSSHAGRYEQVRSFIDTLNQSEMFHSVDLMPGPETVGREDIFMPWLQLAAHDSLEYRRFVIRIPLPEARNWIFGKEQDQ